ncbi:MAG TPA: 2TM domain-containing protein [Polyangiaceae bacterium]|jgi:hypothetical protein
MKTYDQEEVDAILERALRAQGKDGTRLTHEELVAAAAEVGIPKEAIDAAAREGEAVAARATDAQLVATWKRRARLRFARHFVVYFLVNALLALINFLTTPSFPWFGIVTLGWGIGIAMHFMSVFFADEERVLERERRRAEKRARREKWRRRGADFDRAVDHGVRALLEIANTHGARIEMPPRRVRVEGDRELEPDEEEEEEAASRRSRR